MTDGVRWVYTDKHVFHAIYLQHSDEFSVFGTFSDPDGTSPIGCGMPRMMTEWGFKGADYPTIKHERTQQDGEWNHHYWIAEITKEDE